MIWLIISTKVNNYELTGIISQYEQVEFKAA
jgi:hypothetical protein